MDYSNFNVRTDVNACDCTREGGGGHGHRKDRQKWGSLCSNASCTYENIASESSYGKLYAENQ